MDGLASVSEIFLRRFPGSLDALSVGQLVENAVAAQNDEVVVVLNLETFDVWCGDDHFWVALILSSLCFDVAKCAGDGEPTREDAMRAEHDLITHYSRFLVFILHPCHRLRPIDERNWG